MFKDSAKVLTLFVELTITPMENVLVVMKGTL
jgi:hypothetical protein